MQIKLKNKLFFSKFKTLHLNNKNLLLNFTSKYNKKLCKIFKTKLIK